MVYTGKVTEKAGIFSDRPAARKVEAARWEGFYLVILVIYTAAVFLQVGVFSNTAGFKSFLQNIRYLCYLGVLIKLIHDYHTRKSMLAMAILLVIGFLVSVRSDNRSGLFLFWMIFGASSVDPEKILKVSLIVRSAMLAGIVILSQAGVLKDTIRDISDRSRHYLGFSWTTYAPTALLFISLCYFCIRREKMTVAEYAILMMLAYWLFYMTNSRFIFLLNAGAILLAFLIGLRIRVQRKRKTRQKNSWKKIFMAIPAVSAAVAIYLQAAYSKYNPFLSKLNTLLTQRLRLGHNALLKYPITLFGQPISWIGWENPSAYNYVDSAYLQVLLEQGAILLGAVIILYSYMIYRAVKVSDSFLTMSLVIICLLCVTEPRLTETVFNPFILLPFSMCQDWKPGLRENGCECSVLTGLREKSCECSVLTNRSNK